MKKIYLPVLAFSFLLAGGATRAADPVKSSQPAQAAQAKDTTPPSYDMKPQSLQDLDILNQKFVALAQAIPADKFTWQPADGTRSIAAVFLHVSGERYGILGLMGAPPPEGVDVKNIEKSTTDKAQVIEALNKSWAYTKSTIDKMTNGEFAKPQPKLGPDANSGDVVYLLVGDAHEHLGQIVAYARFNGIVPPWTVAAQKRAAAAPAAKPQQ
jgi:uncharacterized damage-inducible protein DinB